MSPLLLQTQKYNKTALEDSLELLQEAKARYDPKILDFKPIIISTNYEKYKSIFRKLNT